MGGRGTLSSRAGRAQAVTCAHSAGRGTRSASMVRCQQLELLVCLCYTLWCRVLLHLLHTSAGGVVSSPLPLLAVSTPASGRPWDYIVQQCGGARDAPRGATDLQCVGVRNWSLRNARGRGLLICNLKRASGSAKLRRYSRATFSQPVEFPAIYHLGLDHAKGAFLWLCECDANPNAKIRCEYANM